MTTRTTTRTVTFQHSFMLDGFERAMPAGSYLVETEEELLDSVLTHAWRRASTAIRLRTVLGTQDVFVDPEQLNAALLRDRAQPDAALSQAVAPPTAPRSRVRNLFAVRARKT